MLDDFDTVIRAFDARHVRFVNKRELTDRDSILCRVIANKTDADGAGDRLELIREMLGDTLDVYPNSCADGGNVDSLPASLVDWLSIIRVYTKSPGKKTDNGHPYTVFHGQTVEDVCLLVHKDFYENLHYARLWRGSNNPVTVSRNETVMDGDIIELHI